MLQYPLANIKMLNTAIVKILQNTTEPERSNKLKVIAVNFLNIILKLFLGHCDEQYCDLHFSEESSFDYTYKAGNYLHWVYNGMDYQGLDTP